MKFSENWLRTYVNPELSSEALAHTLTMAGLEVEALEPVAPALEKLVVAEVLSVEKHPDADRLNVCRVNTGEAEPLQIVCGAKNVHAGAKVPCALVGAKLPGINIKQAKVRGVESFGMLCSAKELGLAEEADGLLLLPSDAPVAKPISEYLELNDKLFTLKLTPNRSDCLSVAGVAREVAAVTATNLFLPKIVAQGAAIQDQFPIKVSEQTACPRYCGRVVRGINPTAATPEWMVRRLERSGLRCISPVVDVTNYVLLELGQPLHAFDLAKLDGGIEVRYAKPGEQLKLLNEQQAELQPDMLVIADAKQALALAGIMGGGDSAVSDTTADIFLESAFFAPEVIAGRARRLGLSTDSSHRFERGVDFAGTSESLERATELIVEICGGQPGPLSEVAGVLPQRDPIQLRKARARRLLGIDISDEAIESLLSRLQLSYVSENGRYFVTPPSYRFDLSIEADLIEEIARLHGYDNIPAIAPKGGLALLPCPETRRGVAGVKSLLVARDFQETITYSFVDAAWEKDFSGTGSALALQNPIASHMSVMRSTLIGGLMDTLIYNLNRKQSRVRLFEVGRCFVSTAEGLQQPLKVAGLLHGEASPEQWGVAARPVDFFDAKADVEALLYPMMARFVAAPHVALHPGQSAQIWLEDRLIGWLGSLHPALQQKFDLPSAPVLFELELDALMQRPVPAYAEVSKFQPVRRDLAVLVDDGLGVQTMLDALKQHAPAMVTAIELFDVYRGKGVEDGKKSLAFRVLMQDTQKTLTDQEVDEGMAMLTRLLADQFGAKLRN